jgi:hypothetical protein
MSARRYEEILILPTSDILLGIMQCSIMTYVWSSLYNETSADAAIDRLNVAITQATVLAVLGVH